MNKISAIDQDEGTESIAGYTIAINPKTMTAVNFCLGTLPAGSPPFYPTDGEFS